ncbi:radical SAM protein [Xanthomonas translucens pv. undulosa]|uniref:radical SAM protein n=1 Tax=Xanthomonas campestris pv. translucens TaxID=343 RepID=UPI003CE96A85
MTALTARKRIKRIQVILKVAERCNLACSYCYYFEGGDRSFVEKPAVINESTISSLAEFLSKGVDELGLDDVWICFHGGEPFMVKPSALDRFCEIFTASLSSKCKLVLSAQTNGAHLNDALIAVINKHRIDVSVSVDGLKHEHDRERRDHKGGGSFDRVKLNYRRLLGNSRQAGLSPIEIIAVLDARNDYRSTIRGLEDELGVQHFNFLLPDCTHEDGIPNGRSARDYGKVLCDIFDAWASSDTIVVREVDDILRRFQLATESSDESRNKSSPGMRYIENQVIVVRSDGELQIDDTYMPAYQWRNDLLKVNLRNVTLSDYLSLPVFDEIDTIFDGTPKACQECIWRNICNGGDIENRYSKDEGFDNPSVYCDGLRMLYRHVALFLRRNGYPRKVLADRLRSGIGEHQFRYAK